MASVRTQALRGVLGFAVLLACGRSGLRFEEDEAFGDAGEQGVGADGPGRGGSSPGSGATGSGATSSSTGGSSTTGGTGSGATGSGATGSGATGSGATGSGATGSGATGSGATGSGATGGFTTGGGPATGGSVGMGGSTGGSAGSVGGSAGTSFGLIRCGEETCEPGAAVCCRNRGVWACAPAGEDCERLTLECTGSSTCDSGLVCCLRFGRSTCEMSCERQDPGPGRGFLLCDSSADCEEGQTCVSGPRGLTFCADNFP